MITECQWKDTNLSVSSPSPVVLGVDPEDRKTVLDQGRRPLPANSKRKTDRPENHCNLMFTIPSIFEAPSS